MRAPALVFAAASLLASPVLAKEGMWMPGQATEIARPLKEAGLKVEPKALADFAAPPMSAIVSIGGCSASFISPKGLVATNHHCTYGTIQYNSKPGKDLLTDGFVAKTLKDELPAAPGTRVFVMEELRDVTAEMTNGVTGDLSGRARFQRLEDNRKAIIAACELNPGRRCDVRTYYGGALYMLQRQMEVRDVRLVYAPAGSVGNYGGEVDNWQWPRHTGDFSFYRAYVGPDGQPADFSPNNVPYVPKSWLRTSKSGVKDGDFVMVIGYPGLTERHRTASETRHFYGRVYPEQQRLLSEYSDLIMAQTKGDEAATIKYANALRGADNFKKKLLGQMDGARNIDLLGKKDAQEQAFRNWVNDKKDRRAQYGPALETLDALLQEVQAAQVAGLRSSLLSRAQLLQAARDMYRWAKEREKPDVAREPGFQDRDRRLITDRITQIERRFDARVDRAIFEQALKEYRSLPSDARNAGFDAAMGQTSLDALYRETQLGDTKTRLSWLTRPAADFEASTDPFIKLAVAMYADDVAGEDKRKDRDGRLQAARSARMAALKAFYQARGQALYPDANGTLRFTYGKVTGRAARDGLVWTPFTTHRGLLQKETGQEPFNSPPKLLERLRKNDFGGLDVKALDGLPVNFLSTVDITNGNSGSATLNAKGELVGLAFDGTMEGVISDWWFDESINRTIHVDSRYMIWVMDKVDDADHLLKEMQVK
jgi:hypothetical protein